MDCKFYLIEDNRLFCAVDEKTFELVNDEWIKSSNNEISDRIIGYDASDSPYAIGNTDIMSSVKELTPEQVIERCGVTVIDKLKMNNTISEQLEAELDKLAEEGNSYYDNDKQKALEIWNNALELIPEPKNRFSQTVWFLAQIGDIYFSKKNYEESFKYFEDAKNNLSGEGYSNPFVMLRLGQCAYEIGNNDTAIEYLLRAYMLEGKDIFEEDDDKYFEFLRTNVNLNTK